MCYEELCAALNVDEERVSSADILNFHLSGLRIEVTGILRAFVSKRTAQIGMGDRLASWVRRPRNLDNGSQPGIPFSSAL